MVCFECDIKFFILNVERINNVMKNVSRLMSKKFILLIALQVNTHMSNQAKNYTDANLHVFF